MQIPTNETKAGCVPKRMINQRCPAFVSAHNIEGRKIMYHKLFRVTLFVTTIAIILAACAAPISSPALATKEPIVTEAAPTATEIAPTNTLEPTATQVVL